MLKPAAKRGSNDDPPTDLTPHPFAEIFPRLAGADLQALAADIAAPGQQAPIVLFEGRVLDGRNRVLACQLAKVPPTVREFTGTREAALALGWSLNFRRRHLTPGQAAACVVQFEALLAGLATTAQTRQKTGKGAQNSGGRGKKTLASLFIGNITGIVTMLPCRSMGSHS